MKASLLSWIITCLTICFTGCYHTDGNKNAQEYGDPLYRHLGVPGFRFLGHTALYAGMDPDDNHKILEMQFSLFSSDGVNENTLESMTNSWWLRYWGAYNSKHPILRPDTFAERQNIMITAINLESLDPGYPFLGGAALVPEGSWGPQVQPDEIDELRCDGLIEYTYEYNGFPVWGKNLITNPGNSDISYLPSEHNDLYDGIPPNDPDTELAPVVQCGKKGGTSTNMVNPAVIDYPTINVHVTHNSGQTFVRIRGTDQSGIHKIEYKWGSNGTVVSTPPYQQHPDQEFQEVNTTTTTTTTKDLYVRIQDGGGNSDGWHIYPID